MKKINLKDYYAHITIDTYVYIPDEIYERKLTNEQLHTAIETLPDKQAKRIYAHYFLSMSVTAIAKAEGVNKSQITRSINQGLLHLEKYLKNIL
ncbi:MAG: sigma factor-like helix-turn-helix DNA-binding protein [Velocimicrobium sp.]